MPTRSSGAADRIGSTIRARIWNRAPRGSAPRRRLVTAEGHRRGDDASAPGGLGWGNRAAYGEHCRAAGGAAAPVLRVGGLSQPVLDDSSAVGGADQPVAQDHPGAEVERLGGPLEGTVHRLT